MSESSNRNDGPTTRRWLAGLASAVACFALAGCGNSEVATAPQGAADAATTFFSAPIMTIPAESGRGGPGRDDKELYPNPDPRDIVRTQRVSALLGGIVIAGRHTLVFAPGALTKDTDITLVDKTNSLGFVQVECYPEGLKFRLPVVLTCGLGGLPYLGNVFMYWWDPSAKSWVNIGGSLTKGNLGIAVLLQHFSIYRPGTLGSKAGW